MCLAIPGRIVNMPGEEQPLAAVEVSGVRRKVNIELLREQGLARDDWVLIHVGFAMSKLSAEQAEEQLRLLDMLGETGAALEEVRGYGSAGDPFDPLGRNPFEDHSSEDKPSGAVHAEAGPLEEKPLEEP